MQSTAEHNGQHPPAALNGAIRAAFTTMRRDGKARHRDIATRLGISEGELIAAHVGAMTDEHTLLQATRLAPQWPQIIATLEALGEVMALTRNESCVHEKIGIYRKVSHTDHVGLVLGGAIDLRIFYRQWAHGFAVSEATTKGEQQSLQFYDHGGTAIHKVFLKPRSDVAAFKGIVTRFTHSDQDLRLIPMEKAAERTTPDEKVDVAAFRAMWSNLRDTHEFFGLLKKFGVSRIQGLRLADPQYVQPVEKSSAQQLLQAAAEKNVSIMVFVGNPGMIQIHTGTVHKIMVMESWINVLDQGFNLHLRGDQIANAYVVRKPTADGVVTSLELFDADGQVIAMFFGERKPGKAELESWRSLIGDLTGSLQHA